MERDLTTIKISKELKEDLKKQVAIRKKKNYDELIRSLLSLKN